MVRARRWHLECVLFVVLMLDMALRHGNYWLCAKVFSAVACMMHKPRRSLHLILAGAAWGLSQTKRIRKRSLEQALMAVLIVEVMLRVHRNHSLESMSRGVFFLVAAGLVAMLIKRLVLIAIERFTTPAPPSRDALKVMVSTVKSATKASRPSRPFPCRWHLERALLAALVADAALRHGHGALLSRRRKGLLLALVVLGAVLFVCAARRSLHQIFIRVLLLSRRINKSTKWFFQQALFVTLLADVLLREHQARPLSSSLLFRRVAQLFATLLAMNMAPRFPSIAVQLFRSSVKHVGIAARRIGNGLKRSAHSPCRRPSHVRQHAPPPRANAPCVQPHCSACKRTPVHVPRVKRRSLECVLGAALVADRLLKFNGGAISHGSDHFGVSALYPQSTKTVADEVVMIGVGAAGQEQLLRTIANSLTLLGVPVLLAFLFICVRWSWKHATFVLLPLAHCAFVIDHAALIACARLLEVAIDLRHIACVLLGSVADFGVYLTLCFARFVYAIAQLAAKSAEVVMNNFGYSMSPRVGSQATQLHADGRSLVYTSSSKSCCEFFDTQNRSARLTSPDSNFRQTREEARRYACTAPPLDLYRFVSLCVAYASVVACGCQTICKSIIGCALRCRHLWAVEVAPHTSEKTTLRRECRRWKVLGNLGNALEYVRISWSRESSSRAFDTSNTSTAKSSRGGQQDMERSVDAFKHVQATQAIGQARSQAAKETPPGLADVQMASDKLDSPATKKRSATCLETCEGEPKAASESHDTFRSVLHSWAQKQLEVAQHKRRKADAAQQAAGVELASEGRAVAREVAAASDVRGASPSCGSKAAEVVSLPLKMDVNKATDAKVSCEPAGAPSPAQEAAAAPDVRCASPSCCGKAVRVKALLGKTKGKKRLLGIRHGPPKKTLRVPALAVAAAAARACGQSLKHALALANAPVSLAALEVALTVRRRRRLAACA